MKKTTLITTLGFVALIGCNQKKELTHNDHKPEIEIYLPEERIISQDGTELNKEWFFADHLRNDEYFIQENKYYQKYARYDSLNDNYIHAGSFIANQYDLQEQPFIKSDEIIEFDFKESKIKFSPSGVKKIWHLPPNFNFSRQFIAYPFSAHLL